MLLGDCVQVTSVFKSTKPERIPSSHLDRVLRQHCHWTGAATGPEVTSALREGISFYSKLQQADGHWPGDYGGPMFLMPGLVITCYVTGCLDTVLTAPHKAEMLRYLKNHQNSDGGYGLHIEGHSTMFGTALRYGVSQANLLFFRHSRAQTLICLSCAPCSYVTMRILGLPAEDETCETARRWVSGGGYSLYHK